MESWIAKALMGGLGAEVAVYAAALGGSVCHYVATARGADAPLSLRAFGRHLFPRDLLRSPWTRLDIAYYVSNKILLAFLFPSVVAMAVVVARATGVALEAALGHAPASVASLPLLAPFLLVGLLLRDFAGFAIHYLQHRVPLLWEFHAVHHAPESLVPPTGHRLHPVDQLAGLAAEALTLGALVGGFAWLMSRDLDGLILATASLYAVVNIVTFAPLRHSHIDLRLPWLAWLLLSPAHHRLHHSRELHHLDKNFAAIFPFWDRLFRTLHDPPPANTYRLGLHGGKSNDYSTLPSCYGAPFQKIHAAWRANGLRSLLRWVRREDVAYSRGISGAHPYPTSHSAARES